MAETSLTVWECELSRFGCLANLDVRSESNESLVVTLQDLDSNKKYVIWFSDVLGYRFEKAFGTQRLGNTFKILDSPWIESMSRKPCRCEPIDTAQHYLISSMQGELEVVSLVAPKIEVSGPT
jgi:hypothetical protein